MLFLLAVTLLAALTIARRMLEPQCPACAGKTWRDQPPRLECANCGWSNIALATVPVVIAEPRPTQYEIGLR